MAIEMLARNREPQTPQKPLTAKGFPAIGNTTTDKVAAALMKQSMAPGGANTHPSQSFAKIITAMLGAYKKSQADDEKAGRKAARRSFVDNYGNFTHKATGAGTMPSEDGTETFVREEDAPGDFDSLYEPEYRKTDPHERLQRAMKETPNLHEDDIPAAVNRAQIMHPDLRDGANLTTAQKRTNATIDTNRSKLMGELKDYQAKENRERAKLFKESGLKVEKGAPMPDQFRPLSLPEAANKMQSEVFNTEGGLDVFGAEKAPALKRMWQHSTKRKFGQDPEYDGMWATLGRPTIIAETGQDPAAAAAVPQTTPAVPDPAVPAAPVPNAVEAAADPKAAVAAAMAQEQGVAPGTMTGAPGGMTPGSIDPAALTGDVIQQVQRERAAREADVGVTENPADPDAPAFTSHPLPANVQSPMPQPGGAEPMPRPGPAPSQMQVENVLPPPGLHEPGTPPMNVPDPRANVTAAMAPPTTAPAPMAAPAPMPASMLKPAPMPETVKAPPPPEAIEMLVSGQGSPQQFDAVFGAGASDWIYQQMGQDMQGIHY